MFAKRERPEGTITHYDEIVKGAILYCVIGSCNGNVQALKIVSGLKGDPDAGPYFECLELDFDTLKMKKNSDTGKTIQSEHFVNDRNMDPSREDQRYNDNYFFWKKADAEKARDFFRSNFTRSYRMETV
ncbi:hypothetical protein PP939_gp092 [Rhizobium phage RL38J1]|uniref:Uncharacterized protein n=1 Tax=Rhizobium phage RL38J1 TaxID=2663232 RepID=A0A6B9JCS1_9CAUD|nr:hypothetical protein PP939_gp092 [Rhizobium phage RL38J1]QGZ13956.1 hypothetical protein RL38J1_092 [Rhizobium phage RL38J1]